MLASYNSIEQTLTASDARFLEDFSFDPSVDSGGRTALHFAAAEGHKEIVQVLLKANKDAYLKADEDGRIPLHLAAMRGRLEVMEELINTKAQSTESPSKKWKAALKKEAQTQSTTSEWTKKYMKYKSNYYENIRDGGHID
ncbi:hypothetical protein Patl1_33602 [Pistacia atlantica]|uniref:Uncharacterized protein n=1 Tax=Pistacia atlantica TaxID=434234 RepID=A0ACC0ZTY9_9ROSI|nr:hypothetical protein Patl1_33602 [Pistacia atlantica]